MADYSARIGQYLAGLISRAGALLAPAGIDQGDGTAAVLTNVVTTATPIAAGTAGNTVLKATAGYLGGALVTTAGAHAMTFQDGAGNTIGFIAANTAAGTYVPFNMPAAGSITAIGNATNPAVTVSFA